MEENPFNTDTSANSAGKNIISMPAATHYQSPLLTTQDNRCSHSLFIIVNCCIYISFDRTRRRFLPFWQTRMDCYVCWCKPRSRPAREKVQTCLNSSNLGKQSANVLELFFLSERNICVCIFKFNNKFIRSLKFSQNQKVNAQDIYLYDL